MAYSIPRYPYQTTPAEDPLAQQRRLAAYQSMTQLGSTGPVGGFPPLTTGATLPVQTLTAPQPQLQAPAMPVLPDYSKQTGADLSNISSLLNPSYGDMNEARTKAAALSYGQGMTGGGFANNTLYKMLDSEKLKRQEAGNQMLAPYLNRNTSLQTASMAQEGENYRAALDGQNAMQRLQLSESGQMARLTYSEKAALERQVLQGQQALNNIKAQGGQEMEKLKYASAEELKQLAIKGQQALANIEAQDRGAMDRTNAQNRAELERTVLLGQQAMQRIGAEGQNQLQQGYQRGMFGLEDTSLRGQYTLAGGNLNPQTQQALSNRLSGAGASTISNVFQRYAPTAGYNPQMMQQTNNNIYPIRGSVDMFGSGTNQPAFGGGGYPQQDLTNFGYYPEGMP